MSDHLPQLDKLTNNPQTNLSDLANQNICAQQMEL